MHSSEPDEVAQPPYPAPEIWLKEGQYFPTPMIWGTGALALAVAALSVWCTVRGALVWATVLALVFAVLALAALTFGLYEGHFKAPRLINAVTLGRATKRPVDDWVHFYRERPQGIWVRVWILLTGVGTAVLLALPLPQILARPGGAWWLFLFVPLLVIGGGSGVYWLLQTVLDAKNSSFGRIPVGLTLGRHGISRYLVAGGVTFVPWERIASVEALPHSTVRVNYVGSEPLEFVATALEERAQLSYCAVKIYAEHPELTSEVGTTTGQRRLEAWHDALERASA